MQYFSTINGWAFKFVDGCTPIYMTKGSIGADVFSYKKILIPAGETRKVPLGIWIERVLMPFYSPVKYMDIQIRPRSSMSLKGYIVHVSTIDCDYKGELHAIITNTSKAHLYIQEGDRVAQLVVGTAARIGEFITKEVDRNGGFGSTAE